MGRSGYTSLSIEEKRYAKLRKMFDTSIKTDKSFTVWVMDLIEDSLERQKKIAPFQLKFVGNKSNGCIIEDKGTIIEINITANNISCSQDKTICKHIIFACLHPNFSF